MEFYPLTLKVKEGMSQFLLFSTLLWPGLSLAGTNYRV